MISGDSVQMFQRALIFLAETMKKWNKTLIGKNALKYAPKDYTKDVIIIIDSTGFNDK